jgi:hypothetical protein
MSKRCQEMRATAQRHELVAVFHSPPSCCEQLLVLVFDLSNCNDLHWGRAGYKST